MSDAMQVASVNPRRSAVRGRRKGGVQNEVPLVLLGRARTAKADERLANASTSEDGDAEDAIVSAQSAEDVAADGGCTLCNGTGLLWGGRLHDPCPLCSDASQEIGEAAVVQGSTAAELESDGVPSEDAGDSQQDASSSKAEEDSGLVTAEGDTATPQVPPGSWQTAKVALPVVPVENLHAPPPGLGASAPPGLGAPPGLSSPTRAVASQRTALNSFGSEYQPAQRRQAYSVAASTMQRHDPQVNAWAPFVQQKLEHTAPFRLPSEYFGGSGNGSGSGKGAGRNSYDGVSVQHTGASDGGYGQIQSSLSDGARPVDNAERTPLRTPLRKAASLFVPTMMDGDAAKKSGGAAKRSDQIPASPPR